MQKAALLKRPFIYDGVVIINRALLLLHSPRY